MNNKQIPKGNITVYITLIIIVLLIIAGIFWVNSRNSIKQPDTTQQTNQPQIKVTDYSGGIPQNQKTAVLIEHSDSTFEKIILPSAGVDNFIKNLPAEDKFISKTPFK